MALLVNPTTASNYPTDVDVLTAGKKLDERLRAMCGKANLKFTSSLYRTLVREY